MGRGNRSQEDIDEDAGSVTAPTRINDDAIMTGRPELLNKLTPSGMSQEECKEEEVKEVGAALKPSTVPVVGDQEERVAAAATNRNRRTPRILLHPSEMEDDSEEEDNTTTNSDVPGAFNVPGRNGPRDDDDTVQYSMGISNENSLEASRQRDVMETSGDDDLVVAELAPTTVEGTAIKEGEDQPESSTYAKPIIVVLAIVAVSFAIVVVIIVVFTQNGEEKSTVESQPTRRPTPRPTPPPSPNPTPAPSPQPTRQPTPNPTTALPTPQPTMDSSMLERIVIAMLSIYIPDVPSSTIQHLAIDWLVINDGGHVATQQKYMLLERFVLAIMFYTMDGNNWDDSPPHSDTWLSNDSVCTWRDIECGDDGKVDYVDLSSDNLSGTIPTEIGSLTALTWLDLYTNNLSGTIPSELGGLTNLNWLELDTNNLSGTIPSELGGLTSLIWLTLFNNNLIGTIPSELGNMSAMTYLSLSNNNLIGTIPSELANMSALQYLRLYNNNLTGSIPSQLIPILESLTECYLGGMDLIGLPSNCK